MKLCWVISMISVLNDYNENNFIIQVSEQFLSDNYVQDIPINARQHTGQTFMCSWIMCEESKHYQITIKQSETQIGLQLKTNVSK